MHFTPKHLHFKISLAKKVKGIFCCAYGCTNKPGKKKGGLCSKHHNRKCRIADPVYDRYKNFKHNALRRHKDFTITLEEFRKFCNDTGYIIKKGMRGRNCTIGRIRNQFGYHTWNIQLVRFDKNLDKYINKDRFEEDLPF